MRVKSTTLSPVAFILALALLAIPSQALAKLNVEFELSDSVLTLGDRISGQLKVNGAKKGVAIIFPKIEGLVFKQIGSPMSTSRTVIINGKVDQFSGLVYKISIYAQKTGNFKIPPIAVTHDSKKYHTKPFSIKIIAPGQQSSMRVILAASKKNIFPQEPFIITLKWAIQERIEGYEFFFPLLDRKDTLKLQLAGNQDKANTSELQVNNYNIPFVRSSETINNEDYSVYSVKFKIFPSDSGSLSIPAASVKARVRRGSQFTTNFFGERVRVPKLEKIFAISEPLDIQVDPLPTKNRPDSFSGAIGDYRIELHSETQRAKVGDPIELIIRISGKGRLDKLKAPLLSEIPKYRDQFVIVDNLQPGDIQDDVISFRQVIRPKNDSITEIPAIPFSFFDIEQRDYLTTTSNSLPLKVLPAKEVTQSDVVNYNETPSINVRKFTKANRGLQANYTFEDALQSQGQHWSWILALLFPPIFYLSTLVFAKRRQSLSENQALARSRSAKTLKNKKLKALKNRIRCEEAFYQTLSAIMSEYISNKLDLGSGELTAIDIENLGKSGRIPENLGETVSHFIQECDRYRFSGQQNSIEEKEKAHTEAAKILKQMDGKI